MPAHRHDRADRGRSGKRRKSCQKLVSATLRGEEPRVRKGWAMQVTRVEERDSGWEDPHPRFRAYLHGSSETTTRGWTDIYDTTGADVLQVIDWERQARYRLAYAVALVRERERLNPGQGRGLVWLVGMDGPAYGCKPLTSANAVAR